MIKEFLFVLIVSLNPVQLYGQSTDTWIGFQTRNNATFPNEQKFPTIENEFLIRYSIGIVGRILLRENIIGYFIAPIRKGNISFDFGCNFLLKGFNYTIGNISTTTDNLHIELPLLLSFHDKRNIFISRKMIRNGITTTARTGLKISINPKPKSLSILENSLEKITETIQGRRVNPLFSSSIGIIKNHKNGNISIMEFAANIGFLKDQKGEISYFDSDLQETTNYPFVNRGSYFSINTVHYFQKKNIDRITLLKRKKHPILFNPRF